MKNHYRLSSFWSFLIIGFGVAFSLALFPHSAKAVNAGEFVHFKIDSELDVPMDLTGQKVTVTWTCNGTGFGSVQDNTASESTNALDGTIKVPSVSKEMTDAGCDFVGDKTILGASASLDGWVTREWSGVAIPASTTAAFTTRASMDYNFVVGLVKSELGGALTLDGTTASASYSGGYRYYAVTGSGTLTGGADGYVNESLAITYDGTVSQSADFNSSTDSTYDGDPLPFAVKATLNKSDRSGLTYSSVAGATVTAGNSLGIPCTDNSDGTYYCAVPIAHTGVLASAASIPVGGLSENINCTYTDRTTPGAVQSTCTISANEPSSGGGNSSGGSAYVAVVTPTPTPDVTSTPTPTPTPTVTSTPTPTPTPTVIIAKLYRKVSDPKVYILGSDGKLTWIKTLAEFNAGGYRWSDVKVISGAEFAKLGVKSYLGVKKGVILNIRKSASIASVILGKMKLNDIYEKTGQSGVWLMINFNGQTGWVH